MTLFSCSTKFSGHADHWTWSSWELKWMARDSVKTYVHTGHVSMTCSWMTYGGVVHETMEGVKI